jgi:hypothetical protein
MPDPAWEVISFATPGNSIQVTSETEREGHDFVCDRSDFVANSYNGGFRARGLD